MIFRDGRDTGISAQWAFKNFHFCAQAHTLKHHYELLHLPPVCSPCDSEVYLGSRPMRDPNSTPGSSDGKFQHSADSATMEEQRQVESSSQSLARLTIMCQNWRSFTIAPPALPLMDAQVGHQMWPGSMTAGSSHKLAAI